jgi:hypothetical protein
MHRSTTFVPRFMVVPLVTIATLLSWGGGACELAADEAGPAMVSINVMDMGKLLVPAEFKQVEPQSQIVEHEFEARAGEEVARVTMMQAGGDVKSNIQRWRGQFVGGDKQANTTEEMSVGPWTVHLVDLNGSFGERMGGGPFAGGKVVQREGYAMTAAILVPPGATDQGPKYFIKMIGPASVIKANRERLITMVKSVGNE